VLNFSIKVLTKSVRGIVTSLISINGFGASLDFHAEMAKIVHLMDSIFLYDGFKML